MKSREAQTHTEKPRSNKALYIVLSIVLVLVVLLLMGVLYYMKAQNVTGRFPEQTYINGIDVSGMSASRAKAALADQAENYTLTISLRDGDMATITSDDIGLTYVDNGDVDALLASYDPYQWFFDNRRVDELSADTDTTMDEALALESIQALTCFSRYTAVADACLIVENKQYVVQEEVIGNQLDEEAAVTAIFDAVQAKQTSIDLEELRLYLAPEIYSDDATLLETAARLNGYLEACVTLDFGDDRIITINSSVILGWIAEDEDGVLNLDYDLAYDYVRTKIAYKIDTFGLTHTVTTNSGYVVKLTGGDYGWCLARGSTTNTILAAVEAGLTTQVEPSWQYSAQNLGYDDIGGTYIEISISEQMMWCYKDYEVIVETPIVTGNVSKGTNTPYGSVWAIDGMQKDAVLGTLDTMGYSSPVSYWMPFTGNVGIHDADGWRNSYGGTIYLTNGSHGCVNTPLEAVEVIYNTVTVGTAVIVYDLEAEDTVIVSVPGVYEEIVTDEDWDWDD